MKITKNMGVEAGERGVSRGSNSPPLKKIGQNAVKKNSGKRAENLCKKSEKKNKNTGQKTKKNSNMYTAEPLQTEQRFLNS